MTATLTRAATERDWRYIRHTAWCRVTVPNAGDCVECDSPDIVTPVTGGGYRFSARIALFPTVTVAAYLPGSDPLPGRDGARVRMTPSWPINDPLETRYFYDLADVEFEIGDAARVAAVLRSAEPLTITGHRGVPGQPKVTLRVKAHRHGVALRFGYRSCPLLVLRPDEAVAVANAVEHCIGLLNGPAGWWTFAERMTPAELALSPRDAALGVTA